MKTHHYELLISWTGNTGSGTRTLRSYSRNHDVMAVGLETIAASSDPAFEATQPAGTQSSFSWHRLLSVICFGTWE